MIERQIAKPMPKPPGLVVWNATKTRLRLSGSMPSQRLRAPPISGRIDLVLYGR
jgi:hypothetical protein